MTHHTFCCIDGHTAGMPVRMVFSGVPGLYGDDQAARRQHFVDACDWIRCALTMEPRGYAFMSGTLLSPPSSQSYDMAFLFIETSGSLPMCGHATIGSVTFAIEHGLVHPQVPVTVRIETPAGLVTANYTMSGNKVTSVRFTNVPSFLLHRAVEIHVAGMGKLQLDIAYGGNFYAIVERQQNFSDVDDYSPSKLLRLGRIVREAVNQTIDVVHPEMPGIHGVKHCMWTGRAASDSADSRIVVIVGDPLIDRSPCGTRTSARVAQRASRGLLQHGEQYVHESLIGGQFVGRIEEHTTVGSLPAVRPSVEGRAYITGLNTIFVNRDEPFADGFLIG